MVYKVEMAAKAYKVARKLPKNVQEEIVRISKDVLSQDPYSGKQLIGKYSFLHSLHFKIKGTQYRIIYEISDKTKRVLIRLATSRENLYRRLDHMKIKSLSF